MDDREPTIEEALAQWEDMIKAELEAEASGSPKFPQAPSGPGELEDARLVVHVAEAVLEGVYVWHSGLGWHHWTGRVWEETPEEAVSEVIRMCLTRVDVTSAGNMSLALASATSTMAAGAHLSLNGVTFYTD